MSFPQLHHWDFAFSPQSTVSSGEAIEEYRPGGFHPMTVGMIISSPKARYRIIQKLGYGGYSTVWLVEDFDRRGCSALRVSKAEVSSEREEEVLKRINASSDTVHFPVIFDRFVIEGPNGSHWALVSEVITPVWAALPFLPDVSAFPRLDSAVTSQSVPLASKDPLAGPAPSTRKALARSLVEAVRDLHANDIVHGDLHFGNIGLPLPVLTDGHDKEYIRVCPDVTVVLPLDPEIAKFAAHFPPYVVERWNWHGYIQAIGGEHVSTTVKIFDFGSAHCLEKPRPNSGFVYQIIPPEWVIQGPGVHDTPTAACDIWALGLMLFSLIAGGMYPYSAYQGSSSFIPMARLSGRIPESWKKIHTWASDPRLSVDVCEETCAETWAGYRQYLRPNCASDEDMEALISLLKRIFALDPNERPNATEILQDAWF